MSDQLWEAIQPTIATLIRQEHLPDDFIQTVADYFFPLALRLRDQQSRHSGPFIVGVNGAQGTGKSTLALFLETLLSQHLDCPCARFSLDDIYLTHGERLALAKAVHPLLQTRGVPGTHDLELGNRVLDQLIAADVDDVVPIPSFDKARDDRAPLQEWPLHRGRVQIILLEGWCVAARAETDPERLQRGINALEINEDAHGEWRRYVNEHLATDYQRFFQRLNYLVMLKAPSMECILAWRTLQEQKLAERMAAHQNGSGATRLMSPQQIERFIMHYERLTRVMLEEMPARADVLFSIDVNHHISGVRYRD